MPRRTITFKKRHSACPDCGQTYDLNRRLTHLDTCPSGNSLDAVSAADREYFEHYPERSNWCRPITRAEVTELLTLLPPLAEGETLGGVVVVTALMPGLRHKKFHPHVIPRGSA